jgi:diguanylate cyclase (GGDEF)-like protein
VSARLTLGLIGLLLLTGLVSGGAIYQMHAMTASLDRLVQDNFEPLLDAEDLVQRVQILVALSPKLLNARNSFEIDNLQLQIIDMFDVLDRRFGRIGHSGQFTYHNAMISKQRDALRVAIDQLITLVRRQMQLRDDMSNARHSVDTMLNPASATTSGAQNSDPRQGIALAAILYQASLATDQAEIDRCREAVRLVLSQPAGDGSALPTRVIAALVNGESSLFSIRERQLALERKLQGEAGNTNLRANQLVYAVANLSAELRQLAQAARQEGRASVGRATIRTSIVLIIAAIIDLALVAYLQVSVLRRLMALRNSVVSRAAGSPVPVDDDGQDEIGDLARSLRHFIEQIGLKEDELRLLAATDALTGLANRREFMARGQGEMTRAHRYGTNVCVLMMDIDHFKRVNDTWGHGVGDDVIRQVAATAVEAFRIVDVIGRIGGEEFAVLLPETSLDGALVAAERMRANVESRKVVTADARNLTVTISIGVAQMTQDEQTLSHLLGRADTALYDAKQLGRNRVCVERLTQLQRQSS